MQDTDNSLKFPPDPVIESYLNITQRAHKQQAERPLTAGWQIFSYWRKSMAEVKGLCE